MENSEKVAEAIIELALIISNQRKTFEQMQKRLGDLQDYKDSKEIPF